MTIFSNYLFYESRVTNRKYENDERGKEKKILRKNLLNDNSSYSFQHGFYPGYYACFILAAVETYAGRGIRRQIRPYFQKNQITKAVYAGITWFGTQIALNFAVTPFVLMEVPRVWLFYKSWYFIVPIVSLILAITLNGASTKSTKKQETDKKKSS